MKEIIEVLLKHLKEIMAVLLGVTVCVCITVPVIASMWHVGEVSDTFRGKIFDMLTFIAGIVSGWLLGTKLEPPK